MRGMLISLFKVHQSRAKFMSLSIKASYPNSCLTPFLNFLFSIAILENATLRVYILEKWLLNLLLLTVQHYLDYQASP